jgi:hypothetical protein
MARKNFDVLVGLGDIAEIAQVSRPAVSNWRKRKKEFPEPRVETAAGPLFDLREVEAWLLANEKIDRPVQPEDLLWRLGDALRSVWSSEQVWQFILSSLVYLVACDRDDVELGGSRCWGEVRSEPDDRLLAALRAAGARVEDQNHRLHDLLTPGFDQQPDPEPGLVRELLDALAAIVRDEPRSMEFFHEAEARLFSVDRFAGEYSTPDAIAYLLVRLMDPLGEVVVDPAVGLGGLLLMAATVPDPAPSRLYGYDTNRLAVRYARAWMYVYGVAADLELRDALAGGANVDPWTLFEEQDRLSADTVLLDPPVQSGKLGGRRGLRRASLALGRPATRQRRHGLAPGRAQPPGPNRTRSRRVAPGIDPQRRARGSDPRAARHGRARRSRHPPPRPAASRHLDPAHPLAAEAHA